LLARDGRDLPPNEAVPQQTLIPSAAGVTRDMEFSLPSGTYSISVGHRAAGSFTGHVTTVPIRVR
ncbi:MAG: hypothetical protein ACT4QD_14050, partial [Acidobacteriota bacterium]